MDEYLVFIFVLRITLAISLSLQTEHTVIQQILS